MYTLEEISAPDRLAALAPEWASLAAPAGNPLLHPDWSIACARAWEGRSPVVVQALRRDGELVGVAPLRLSPVRPARLVSLFDRTAEPSYVLHRDQASVEELCRRVLATRLPLRLPRLEVDSPALPLLRDGVRAPGSVVLDEPRRTNRAVYDGGWEAFEAALSSSSRSWLRRKRRKLEQAGAVGFEALSPEPGEVASLLERLALVEAASWKGREGTAISQDPWLQRLLTTYAEAAAGRGAIRFFFLTVGEDTVAAQLYAVDGGHLWQLKIGYVDAHAAASPGILLQHEVHRHACEEGLTGLEYLGRAESWQERWPIVFREHVRVSTYPFTPSGLVHRARDAALRAQAHRQERAEPRAQERAAAPGD
ncbi:GNAT family N-acetyltransferase [Nocardioides marmoribigeumensis]|uniref:CelD/BcsL family acetyltransferase involved in cellulose biosynthesis n=1 Tax=Nocardioides marmoribigeumensis TaxID=433649 RepID=A0ABU2C1R2_9ACTN|nr:GNAT family N-acetyltransferase [Nocardioides marmoribigeumensis]MDR7364509.1 CelD/BcsL family acetyltransferase involved in cellulose biosynthesis [Nocardioides marmoribigeumensis]